jgi:hypothetical protein
MNRIVNSKKFASSRSLGVTPGLPPLAFTGDRPPADWAHFFFRELRISFFWRNLLIFLYGG